MPKTILEILRLRDTGNQTLGKLTVFVEGKIVRDLVSLEPSWLFNLPSVSCIPADSYKGRKHNSPKFGKCLLVENVPGRTNVLFHKLNFYNETEGCIGVGLRFAYINSDLMYDLQSSESAMDSLLACLPDTFEIVIKQAPAFQTAYVQREILV
jgi:Family of unknown function (DUF5675)